MSTRRRHHVLLIDDNADARFLVTRAVHRSGLAVTLSTAGDGDHGIARLAGTGAYADRERYPPPAMVLLDWKLPGRPSCDVLAWIRAQQALAELPVVVFTTSQEDEDRRAAHEAGASAFVSKPGRSEDLAAVIRGTLLTWLPPLAAAPAEPDT